MARSEGANKPTLPIEINIDSKNSAEEQYSLTPSQVHAQLSTPSLPQPTESIHGNGYYCTEDQCSLRGPQVQTQSSSPLLQAPEKMSPSQNVFTLDSNKMTANNSTMEKELQVNNNYLSDIIPVDLYNMIITAAKQGMLSSFLLTIEGELLTEYLKAHHYSAMQIHWINQIIRGLSMVAMGAPLGTTIPMPIVNYFLTDYLRLNKEKVNQVTTGTLLTVGMLTSPVSFIGTSLIMGASICTNIRRTKPSRQ